MSRRRRSYREEPGLETSADLDGAQLTLKHYPFRIYMVCATFALVATMFLRDMPSAWLFVILFAASWPDLLGRPLEVGIRPTGVHLKGWIGRVPIPRELDLGHPLSVTWKPSASVRIKRNQSIRRWQLTFQSANSKHVVEGIQCAEYELLQLREQLVEVRHLLEDRDGLGELEIPVSLREVVRVGEDSQ